MQPVPRLLQEKDIGVSGIKNPSVVYQANGLPKEIQKIIAGYIVCDNAFVRAVLEKNELYSPQILNIDEIECLEKIYQCDDGFVIKGSNTNLKYQFNNGVAIRSEVINEKISGFFDDSVWTFTLRGRVFSSCNKVTGIRKEIYIEPQSIGVEPRDFQVSRSQEVIVFLAVANKDLWALVYDFNLNKIKQGCICTRWNYIPEFKLTNDAIMIKVCYTTVRNIPAVELRVFDLASLCCLSEHEDSIFATSKHAIITSKWNTIEIWNTFAGQPPKCVKLLNRRIDIIPHLKNLYFVDDHIFISYEARVLGIGEDSIKVWDINKDNYLLKYALSEGDQFRGAYKTNDYFFVFIQSGNKLKILDIGQYQIFKDYFLTQLTVAQAKLLHDISCRWVKRSFSDSQKAVLETMLKDAEKVLAKNDLYKGLKRVSLTW